MFIKGISHLTRDKQNGALSFGEMRLRSLLKLAHVANEVAGQRNVTSTACNEMWHQFTTILDGMIFHCTNPGADAQIYCPLWSLDGTIFTDHCRWR